MHTRGYFYNISSRYAVTIWIYGAYFCIDYIVKQTIITSYNI